MKHLNFFSKRQTCSHNVVTLASTVGSPSAHRRSAMLRLLSVLVLVLTFGVGQMWGAEDDHHDFSQNIAAGLNNNASISSINISDQGYPIKSIIITCRYNKTINPAVTISVNVNEESFASNQTVGNNFNDSKTFNGDASGDVTINFTNNTGNGTGHGTFYVTNVRLVEGAPAATYDVNWSIKGVVIDTENTNGKPTVPDAVADLVADETCNGKVFVGWTANPTNDGSRPTDLFTTQAGTSISDDITYYAVFANETEGDPTWQKTTSISVGDVVVFVNETNSYEMTGVSSNLGQATSYTSVQGTYPLTIEAGNSGNGYSFKNGSNYLSYSGSSNQLQTSTTKNANSSWTISTSTDGNFKLANVNTTSRILQYNHNSGNPRWACYGNSLQSAFQIYKQVASITYSNYATSCCTELAQINGSFF